MTTLVHFEKNVAAWYQLERQILTLQDCKLKPLQSKDELLQF